MLAGNDTSSSPETKAAAAPGTDQIANAFFSKFNSMDTGGSKTSEMYSSFAGQYEHDLLNMSHGYTHPEKIALVAEAHLPDKDCRILDVCAGTGLGGMALKKLGFTNIDAIDGSSGMLEEAAKKLVYRQMFEELIGHEKVASVQQGSYDAVVTSGSFLSGHLGPMHLRPLAGVLKSGGFFCMALREEFLHSDFLASLEPTMALMEQEGVWQKVTWGVMEHYYNDLPGKYYVYRRL